MELHLEFSYRVALDRQMVGRGPSGRRVVFSVTEGRESAYEDQYFRTGPLLECGDARYEWVNRSIFVGRGRMVPGGVEYQVYRVT